LQQQACATAIVALCPKRVLTSRKWGMKNTTKPLKRMPPRRAPRPVRTESLTHVFGRAARAGPVFGQRTAVFTNEPDRVWSGPVGRVQREVSGWWRVGLVTVTRPRSQKHYPGPPGRRPIFEECVANRDQDVGTAESVAPRLVPFGRCGAAGADLRPRWPKRSDTLTATSACLWCPTD